MTPAQQLIKDIVEKYDALVKTEKEWHTKTEQPRKHPFPNKPVYFIDAEQFDAYLAAKNLAESEDNQRKVDATRLWDTVQKTKWSLLSLLPSEIYFPVGGNTWIAKQNNSKYPSNPILLIEHNVSDPASLTIIERIFK